MMELSLAAPGTGSAFCCSAVAGVAAPARSLALPAASAALLLLLWLAKARAFIFMVASVPWDGLEITVPPRCFNSGGALASRVLVTSFGTEVELLVVLKPRPYVHRLMRALSIASSIVGTKAVVAGPEISSSCAVSSDS
jgi:hypothetical protein